MTAVMVFFLEIIPLRPGMTPLRVHQSDEKSRSREFSGQVGRMNIGWCQSPFNHGWYSQSRYVHRSVRIDYHELPVPITDIV